ncbi:MAG: GH92 family glycosyl hydrolase [Odoribacteraceae bacterium]|jgi:predicted alpha-1,2-mannosidase|nr:GH92 family glycosyl hydrolase [Odoribacteraceae bacterium]
MKKNITIYLLLLATASGCGTRENALVRHVNPWAGTGGHGHVFMGASVPFGMVQLGPTSLPREWDWTSGYHISDTTVTGFCHTHLSGTGIGDLADISLLPVAGDVKIARGHAGDPASGTWSYFTRSSERARPGYYATRLDRYGVDVELTATARVGMHRYAYPPGASPSVVIDLENGTGWDAPVEGFLARADDSTVVGYRFSKGWARDQRVYFAARFSRPLLSLQLFDGGTPRAGGDSIRARRVHGKLLFADDARELLVKVALSPTSVTNALLNMEAELPGWDFDETSRQASAAWERELGKIRIKTRDEQVKRVFYTALYHAMIAPSLFCDVNGDYRGADGRVHRGAGFENYTTFSLWDTYRAAHPLATLIHPERVDDWINTMLYIYKQQGKLPVWHLAGCETDCMVGNPAIPVVADAILKGFAGFDRELALEACRVSAMLDERGMGLLKQYGYIPCDLYNESVATGLEYALADGALARAAARAGDDESAAYFLERSLAYRHYFDASTGLVRGRRADGSFREPFDPFNASHRTNDYTEGNAWQYTWLVPHDVEGLIALFGGRERFVEKLDSLFVVQGDLGADASPDISGMIGQYAHGNEPGHHVPYLYALAGEPWKTAERAREILSTLYHDGPDGLPGNEDAGQMSAWYVLSAIGLYQVEPAGGRFVLGSPLVDEAVIDVGDGRLFRVTARNNGPKNVYVRGVTLNGVALERPYVEYEEIIAGGELVFDMSDARP